MAYRHDQSFPYGDENFRIAMAGTSGSNTAPTIVIPGWGTRGQSRIEEVADIFSEANGGGLVYVPEMPHRLARNDPNELLKIYPDVLESTRGLMKRDDEYHLAIHSMGTMALGIAPRAAEDYRLVPRTAVIASGLWPQTSTRLDADKREAQQAHKMLWRFGVLEALTEGGRMRKAGDNINELVENGIYSARDAGNFARHPIELAKVLGGRFNPAEHLITLAVEGAKIGFVHGQNDLVFPFDEVVAAQIPRDLYGCGENSNVDLMKAPASGHPGLAGHLGKIVANHIVAMQNKLLAPAR
jgi:hypothetical protein